MYQGVHNSASRLADLAHSPNIPRRLPRGTHGLDPSLVAASQRTRLLEAVGRTVAEKGYAAATIDDIVRGAGVSKKTFYDHFEDKLQCFLAAYETASNELYEHMQAAQDAVAPAEAGDAWLERTHAGIRAYLRWLAAEPALARVFLIEIAAAGPEALACRERLRDRYAERMRELQDPHIGVPDEIFHAVVAAADDLVVRRLREGSDLLELEPILLRLQVTQLAGPKAAAKLA
jgi:AcrR family transcriptional regulator